MSISTSCNVDEGCQPGTDGRHVIYTSFIRQTDSIIKNKRLTRRTLIARNTTRERFAAAGV